MAINNSSFLYFPFSFVLLLFLFGSSMKVEAHEIKERLEDLLQHRHVITPSSLTAAKVCSTPSNGTEISSSSLQLTHQYGPCSPLKKGNTKMPSLHQTLLDDQIRVKYFNSKAANHAKKDDSTVKLPINLEDPSLGRGAFVVKIGIGTPKQDFVVIFDTGNSLTWIQCMPCAVYCYPQRDPIFDPSKSSTYSNISFGSDACKQLQLLQGKKQPWSSTTCVYHAVYGDGLSKSVGYFARDKLTLSKSDSFLEFRFGCGQRNIGLFGLSSADGLLGIGRKSSSIVSQTAQKYGKIFSYCLPASPSSTGYLAFGNQAGTTSGIQYTQLLKDPRNPYLYFLNLTGISVGGKKLNIPSSVFTTSGTIIDSGTTISRLPPVAYSKLRSAFREGMSKYSVAPSRSILDTCYKSPIFRKLKIPTIVLHFSGGTDLNVDRSGILAKEKSNTFCLAFAGNDDSTDFGILGNMQQKTFEVVHNVAEGKLGFRAKACR